MPALRNPLGVQNIEMFMVCQTKDTQKNFVRIKCLSSRKNSTGVSNDATLFLHFLIARSEPPNKNQSNEEIGAKNQARVLSLGILKPALEQIDNEHPLKLQTRGEEMKLTTTFLDKQIGTEGVINHVY